MYKCMINNLQTIEKLYTISGNHLVCLEGKKGTGKTTVLQEFAHKHKHIIQIESFTSCDNYLSPIINALYQYYNIYKDEFGEMSFRSEFTYEELLLQKLLNICTTSKCAILLYGFANYSKEFIKFIQKSISAILRNGKNCSIFIEIDSDDSLLSSKVQAIYSFPHQEHIFFSEVESQELKKVFLDEHPNIEIKKNDLDYIVSSANKNPAIMNIIVNYLKSKKYIAFYETKYYCKPLQIGILSDILKDDFFSRFNRLDELMKATFLKSSMFGMEFYASHLENSFQIISASETLNKIEKYTNLLFQKDMSPQLYSFSNSETLYFAKSIISDEQKKKWGAILCDYYRKLWEQSIMNVNHSSVNFAIRAAFYAVTACKYNEAVSFYISAIFMCMKENNFQQVLIMLKEIEKLLIYQELPEIIKMHLGEFRANCFENLGQYQKACQSYQDAIRKFKDFEYFDIMKIQYHLAYCTYYTSRVDLALHLAESLKKIITPDSRKDPLYYNVISLLATIYREKANPKFIEMYLIAIKECKEHGFEHEYYVQLRKADLCYDVTLSIPMLQQAVTYFKDNHCQKEYGKAIHNLGTDFLYSGNPRNALEYLMESKNVFAKFGSVDEVYAINCIGVWYAIIENNYQHALQFFHQAEHMQINDFKKMTVYANIASCYQKLELYEKCQEYIHKCELLPARQQNKDVGFYQRTVLFTWAFFYMEQKKYSESLKMFRSCWDIALKNDQSYLVANCILNLCKHLNIKPTKMELKFCSISHSKLYEKYYKNKSLFHTLRFIE